MLTQYSEELVILLHAVVTLLAFDNEKPSNIKLISECWTQDTGKFSYKQKTYQSCFKDKHLVTNAQDEECVPTLPTFNFAYRNYCLIYNRNM